MLFVLEVFLAIVIMLFIGALFVLIGVGAYRLGVWIEERGRKKQKEKEMAE